MIVLPDGTAYEGPRALASREASVPVSTVVALFEKWAQRAERFGQLETATGPIGELARAKASGWADAAVEMHEELLGPL